MVKDQGDRSTIDSGQDAAGRGTRRAVLGNEGSGHESGLSP